MAIELTDAQKEDVLEDYRNWSGGFTPGETPAEEIETYVDFAMDVNLDTDAVRDFLHSCE